MIKKKKHDTDWSLISERFLSHDFQSEPYRWATISEINYRNQPRRESKVHFLLFIIFDCDDNFYAHNSFVFLVVSRLLWKLCFRIYIQRLIVRHRFLTITKLLNPKFEISFLKVIEAIIVLFSLFFFFFFFSHAFTNIDYPIAVPDVSIYHSGEECFSRALIG